MAYVALLRGINVGGNNRIKMADLKAACTSVGWQNVTSYIQSGNLLFESTLQEQELENQLQQLLKTEFNMEVPVMVISKKSWQQAIEEMPFTPSEKQEVHLTWLKSVPTEMQIAQANEKVVPTEKMEVIQQRVYLQLTPPYHTTKLSIQLFEKVFKTKATNRNWKTTLKINQLLQSY